MSSPRTIKRQDDLGRLERRVALLKDPVAQDVPAETASLPSGGQVKKFSLLESKSSISGLPLERSEQESNAPTDQNADNRGVEVGERTTVVTGDDLIPEVLVASVVGLDGGPTEMISVPGPDRTPSTRSPGGFGDRELVIADSTPVPGLISPSPLLSEGSIVERPERAGVDVTGTALIADSVAPKEGDKKQILVRDSKRDSVRSPQVRQVERSKSLKVQGNKGVIANSDDLDLAPGVLDVLNEMRSILPNIGIIGPRLTKRREGRVYSPRPKLSPSEEKFERGYKITYDQNNMLMAIRRKWQTPRTPITFSSICTAAIRRYLSVLKGEYEASKSVQHRLLEAVIVGKIKQSVMMTAADLEAIGILHQQLRLAEPKLDISAILGWSIEELYYASESGQIDASIFRKDKRGGEDSTAVN